MIRIEQKFLDDVHHANLGLDFGKSSPHDISHGQFCWPTYPWAMYAEKTECCQSLAVFRVTDRLNRLETMLSHAVTQIEAPFLTALNFDPFHEFFDLISDRCHDN